MRESSPRLLPALLLLLLVTLAAYAPVLRHGFVEWDDPQYVTENTHVRAGLTAAGMAWALTSAENANWHPLTWASHMLDVSLYGLEPWGHHLTSLLLHLANTLLLYGALRRLTRAPWRSLAVAALFALHPLHVESVAWVAERKDVLSTGFWFAALWAYAAFAERPSPRRYVFVALGLALGLTAKPMLVTLPLTLLIVDAWPLARFHGTRPSAVWPLVVEKLPLFALSLAAALEAWLAQKSYGAVTESPHASRIATAILGAYGYLEKMVWPHGLAAFYPYRLHPPALEVVAKAAALVLVTAAVAWAGRRRPYLAAGWAWYLVTLGPVIGLVRIGQQAMADRYTYVPLVGVFVMLVWGVADLAAGARAPATARRAAAVAALLSCGGLAIITRRQVDTWKDGITLWEHALAVSGNSTISQNNLGVALEKAGRLDEAVAHFEEAIRLEPRNARSHGNLADARFAQGRYAEAIPSYDEALRLSPGFEQARENLAKAHYNVGNARWREGHPEEAVREYREAIRSNPDDAGLQRALALALLQQGRRDESLAAIRRSLELDPENPYSHDVLALALCQGGDYAGAWREVQACRAHGGTPTPSWLAELSKRMPEPR